MDKKAQFQVILCLCIECPMHNSALESFVWSKIFDISIIYLLKSVILKYGFFYKSDLRSCCYSFSCQKNVDIFNIIYQITFKSVPLWVGHSLIWMEGHLKLQEHYFSYLWAEPWCSHHRCITTITSSPSLGLEHVVVMPLSYMIPTVETIPAQRHTLHSWL